MPAALLMSNFQASLRTILRYTDNLENIIHELNYQLKSKESGDRFVSFFIAKCDTKKRTLSYINCGHPAPLLKIKNKIIFLDQGTTLIGVFNKLPNFKTCNIKYNKEFILLCYTDGLLDTQNEKEDYYGEERLKNLVLSSDEDFEILNSLIIEDLNSFRGNTIYNDDITILSMKLN